MTRLALAVILVFAFVFAGCPDKRKELIEEVGGAPKRQLDHTQERLDAATKNVEDRMKRATEAAEE